MFRGIFLLKGGILRLIFVYIERFFRGRVRILPFPRSFIIKQNKRGFGCYYV